VLSLAFGGGIEVAGGTPLPDIRNREAIMKWSYDRDRRRLTVTNSQLALVVENLHGVDLADGVPGIFPG